MASYTCYALATVGITMITREAFGLPNYGKTYLVVSLTENIANAVLSSVVGFMYDFSGGYASTLVEEARFHSLRGVSGRFGVEVGIVPGGDELLGDDVLYTFLKVMMHRMNHESAWRASPACSTAPATSP